jgi:hypothetical protein
MRPSLVVSESDAQVYQRQRKANRCHHRPNDGDPINLPTNFEKAARFMSGINRRRLEVPESPPQVVSAWNGILQKHAPG